MRDYTYLEIEDWKNGLPVNNKKYLDWKVLVDKEGQRTKDKTKVSRAKQLTSPYGALNWVVGDEDTFICFDYAELPNGKVIIDAVYNSESGCLIESFAYEVVDKEGLISEVQHLIEKALEVLSANNIEHDSEGWNKSPFDFLKHICDVFKLNFKKEE